MRLIDADKLKKDVLNLPNYYNGFSDTYDKACIIGVIDEQPSAQPEPHWIPCSERLPEYEERVLITIEFENSKFMEFGLCCEGRWGYFAESCNCHWKEIDGVTAWMPLPEPYEVEQI